MYTFERQYESLCGTHFGHVAINALHYDKDNVKCV